MKNKSRIVVGILIAVGLIVAFTVAFFTIQNYSTVMSESVLDLHFEKNEVTVFITDHTRFGSTSRELTVIPIDSLVGAHDKLPKTSMNDRIIQVRLQLRPKKQEHTSHKMMTRNYGIPYEETMIQ